MFECEGVNLPPLPKVQRECLGGARCSFALCVAGRIVERSIGCTCYRIAVKMLEM